MNTRNRSQARENASDQVAIGFSFASYRLRGWREFSRPITERSKAKPMQSRITFDTQLKIAIKHQISSTLLLRGCDAYLCVGRHLLISAVLI